MGDNSFRMQQAWDDGTEKLISASQLNDVPKPYTGKLSCPHCHHPVRAVPEHASTSKNGKPYTVSAHFALQSEKREPGQPERKAEHRPGCPLRPVETLVDIARHSGGLAEVDGDRLELRLVITETTNSKRALLPAPGAPLQPPPARPVRREVVSRQPSLAPAVTSAARIAKFLALYENAPATARQFTVRYTGHPIPWTRFSYGPDPTTLGALYRRLRPGPADHPVAVVGTVLAAGTSRHGQPWRRIAAKVPTGPGQSPRADVYLRSDHPELLAPLTIGTHVLALAAPDVPWKIWTPSHGGDHHLVLWPRAHWQLAYWTTDPATGRISTPRTPPAVTTPRPPRPARPKPPVRNEVQPPPDRGTDPRTTTAPATTTPSSRRDTSPPTAAPTTPASPAENPTTEQNPSPRPAPPPAPPAPPAPPIPPMPRTPPSPLSVPPEEPPQHRPPNTKKGKGFLHRWLRR
ncbi:hypothetical protein ACH4PU_32310 [Streptomyces sp. NPDC021100]|uniref:hypothetical protein n=1 Tax=Streptomyces sp. NPDC021100 TaxID=3365114 RepID=UPI0037938103